MGFWRLQRMWAFESGRIIKHGEARALKELRARRRETESDDAYAEASQWSSYYTEATTVLGRAGTRLQAGSTRKGGAERCIGKALEDLAAAPVPPADRADGASAEERSALPAGARSYAWFRRVLAALAAAQAEMPDDEVVTALAEISQRMHAQLEDDELLGRAWLASLESLEGRHRTEADRVPEVRALLRRHLIPPSEDLDVCVRYETSVERRLQRDIESLVVLQAIRRGTLLPPGPRSLRR